MESRKSRVSNRLRRRRSSERWNSSIYPAAAPGATAARGAGSLRAKGADSVRVAVRRQSGQANAKGNDRSYREAGYCKRAPSRDDRNDGRAGNERDRRTE